MLREFFMPAAFIEEPKRNTAFTTPDGVVRCAAVIVIVALGEAILGGVPSTTDVRRRERPAEVGLRDP